MALRSTGHREPDLLVDRVRRMLDGAFPPGEIAAAALCSVVAQHPFWDANHRTGFEMAQLVLRAFGLKIVATREEIERYVRGIDREGLMESQIAAWIRRRAEPLR